MWNWFLWKENFNYSSMLSVYYSKTHSRKLKCVSYIENVFVKLILSSFYT